MKTIDEIYEAMLETYSQVTGFTMDGSADLAVRLYAAAAEIKSLYAYADWVKNQSFPQTATEQFLDYHGELRGLSRRPASKAQGKIRYYINEALDSDMVILSGYVCATAGLVRFVTTQSGVIKMGNTWTEVAAEAEKTGEAGNTEGGAISYMVTAPVGVAGCGNPLAFTGGAAEESDGDYRARILDSFVRLPNGANAAFYENRVLEHEGVAAVSIIPRYKGIGTVGVVVAGAGGETDPALLDEIYQDLQQIREIAVDITVLSPEEVPVAVDLQIQCDPGKDEAAVLSAVSDAVLGWFGGKRLAKPVYLAQLCSVIFSVNGVYNCKILSPVGDVDIKAYQMPVLDSFSVTGVE